MLLHHRVKVRAQPHVLGVIREVVDLGILQQGVVVIHNAYFLSVVEPMYQSILTNTIENQRLAAFRDTLLPKLMSGEIDVSNVTI